MELEKPLFRAEGESYEDGSEETSKLGTVRMVEGTWALPLAVGCEERLYLGSGDAPLALLLIATGELGASLVFWSALDPELEGGGSVEKAWH